MPRARTSVPRFTAQEASARASVAAMSACASCEVCQRLPGWVRDWYRMIKRVAAWVWLERASSPRHRVRWQFYRHSWATADIVPRAPKIRMQRGSPSPRTSGRRICVWRSSRIFRRPGRCRRERARSSLSRRPAGNAHHYPIGCPRRRVPRWRNGIARVSWARRHDLHTGADHVVLPSTLSTKPASSAGNAASTLIASWVTGWANARM